MKAGLTDALADPKQYSILVVDDVPTNTALLKAIFKQYRVSAAASGQEAIAALSRSSFDLVLLDIVMPGLDGFATLERLHGLPNFGSTPVIFLTASLDDQFENRGLTLGAADYITKPFVIEHVRLRVANVLQRAQLQKQLELALDSAELGLWEWDLCSRCVRIDARRGLPLSIPAEPAPASDWHPYAHPASLPAMNEAFQALQDGTAAVLDLDVQLRSRAGEWVWAHVYGKPTARSSGGQLIRMMGTYRDIAQRKATEDARRSSEERLRLVMEATGEGVWDWILDSHLVTHNAAWCRILGLDENILTHAPDFFKSLIHPEDHEGVMRALHACLGGQGNYVSEHRLKKANGEDVWVLERGVLVERSAEGRPLRMLGSIKDITEQKRAAQEIHKLAFYDVLTGLPNRRLLLDRIGQAIRSNERHDNHSALLFIDMDRFKELNDTFGHEAGDQLLVAVGQRLQSCVRASDTVARLGGDEFIMLANELGAERPAASAAAQMLGQKVLAVLNEAYLLDGTRFESTPSIGLTVFGGGPFSIDSILKRADEAMYRAKANGRNCLRMPLDEEAGLAAG